MTSTCKSSDTSGKDYNALDCTAYPGYDSQSACWSSKPPTGASRTVKCYSVDADGILAVETDTTKCTGTGVNAVPVYLMGNSVTTAPKATCATTGTSSVPADGCVFNDSADDISDVLSSETCTGCMTCPTYAIGVGAFLFNSS